MQKLLFNTFIMKTLCEPNWPYFIPVRKRGYANLDSRW